MLADAVGSEITIDETESSVGDFNVDIDPRFTTTHGINLPYYAPVSDFCDRVRGRRKVLIYSAIGANQSKT